MTSNVQRDQMTNPVIGQALPPNRARILDAAERLLGRYGYRKMTVDDLAAEAGLGKGTIYLSFRSKEEVVLATVDRIVDAVCREMERIRSSGRPAAECLAGMLVARVLVRFDRVSGYRERLDDLLGAIRRSLLERRRLHFERETAVLAAALRDGQRTGALVPGDARRTARALLLATNAFLPYSLSPAELGDRRRLQADTQDVVRLLVRALLVVRATPGQDTPRITTTTRRRGAL